MYVSTDPTNFNPVADLFMAWARKVNPPLSSGTQKEVARAEGKRDGFREGIVQGIASMLNSQRCQRLQHWEKVPLIEQHRVNKLIGEFTTLYQAAGPDLTPTKEAGEQKRLAENEVLINFLKACEAMVIDEEIRESEFLRHKQAVLNGTEKATAADAEWVREELERFQSMAQPLEKLLSSIDPENLRTRRPIKDQPQA